MKKKCIQQDEKYGLHLCDLLNMLHTMSLVFCITCVESQYCWSYPTSDIIFNLLNAVIFLLRNRYCKGMQVNELHICITKKSLIFTFFIIKEYHVHVSLCLIFLYLHFVLAQKPNYEKFAIDSSKFFHNSLVRIQFYLSRASGKWVSEKTDMYALDWFL